MKTSTHSPRHLALLLLGATLALTAPADARLPAEPEVAALEAPEVRASCWDCKSAIQEVFIMAYSTQADIEVMVSPTRLIELTDDSQAGSVDAAVLDACIATADAYIDGYLRGRYTLPIQTTPLPPELVAISRDLSIYEIYSRKGEGGVPEEVRNRRKDAQQRLADIAKGILVLGIAPPDAHQSVPILVDKTEADQEFPKRWLDRF